jgi:hypothetical protein
MPNDQLSHATGVVNDRLSISHFLYDFYSAPQFLAGLFVKGHDECVRLTANDGDKTVSVD